MKAFVSRMAVLVGLALAGGACTPQPPSPPLPTGETSMPDSPRFVAAAWADLPGWSQDDLAQALPALRLSCEALLRRPADSDLGPERRGGQIIDWQPFCAAITQLPVGADDGAVRAVLLGHMQPWQVVGDTGAKGLFTGYYEPELKGALSPSSTYAVPLYGLPDDLVSVDLGQFHDDLKGRSATGRVQGGKLIRYEDRATIDRQGLAGRAPVVAWVDDAVAAFFLHIQGSGRVALAEGGELRVGYAGQNGHRYVAIGKPLIDRGALDAATISMQTIRAWLKANPDQADAVMALNPSYIFFRTIDGPGPLGAQGVALTPGRSLAIDRRLLPLGVPVWLDAVDPLDDRIAIRRLMVAQDTGGAIRGPVRGDVFWGHGPAAEERAGRMKSPGQYWMLLPRALTPTF